MLVEDRTSPIKTETKSVLPQVALSEHLCNAIALRAPVPNNHVPPQNLYHNCWCPDPKYSFSHWVHGPLGIEDFVAKADRARFA